MSITAQQVLDYIDTHPLRFYDGDFSSFLDILHSVYTEYKPIDTKKTHAYFTQLRSTLDKLPPQEADCLFSRMCDFCLEYEQAAFAHGILVGLYLHTELSTLSWHNPNINVEVYQSAPHQSLPFLKGEPLGRCRASA